MLINDFPIGQKLNAVTVIEDKEFNNNELCLDKIQLFFEDVVMTLSPIIDTDEIEITQEYHHNNYELKTPDWCEQFLGKKLMNIWVCENNQEYQDQIILAFDNLHPSISFISEGSVIKVFTYQQVKSIINQNKKLCQVG